MTDILRIAAQEIQRGRETAWELQSNYQESMSGTPSDLKKIVVAQGVPSGISA